MTRKQKALYTAVGLTLLFITFTLLLKLVDVQPVGPQLSEVGFATINAAFAKAIGYNSVFYYLAKALGIVCFVIVGCFALMGAVQLLHTRNIKKVNYRIIAVGALYICVLIFYVFFNIVAVNYRPVLIDGALEPSYPSTHTLIALCVTISAAMVVKGILKNRRLADILTIVLLATGFLTMLFRLFSGVHWLTDIVGGLLLSLMLIGWFKYSLFALRRALR